MYKKSNRYIINSGMVLCLLKDWLSGANKVKNFLKKQKIIV
jgi:hypothetical protein